MSSQRRFYIAHTFNDEQFAFIHLFTQTKTELESLFKQAKLALNKGGLLWISWPKKTSKLPTEIDKFKFKFKVMEYGLTHGLVDTKVVSIDEDWSGHKFMYRVKDQ